MGRIAERALKWKWRGRLPMRERNRVRVGVVGTLLVVIVLAVVFEYRSIPGVSDNSNYRAEFADASGLAVKDDVQVAGVVVGRVKSVELSGDRVEVEFTADTHGVRLGADTRAAIRVGTLLGKRYIELGPEGPGTLAAGATIPLQRTTSGYDISRSLAEVSDTVAKTDKTRLSDALNQAGALLKTVSPDLESSLTGITRLSNTVASRDQAIDDLLAHANGVSGILSQRNEQFALLLADGRSLFGALNTRADEIHRVLVQAKSVFDELSALAQENTASIGPTLTELGTTVETLNKNYKNVSDSISGLRTFVTQLSDVVASGPFFNVLLDNITPATLNNPQPNNSGGPR
ncbi:MCE family protein [Nocardia kruczakiae]|uniref:MCE family protein n=1 Tax=Nocardia kruczakiae TaxID=261477 RepID=UPI000B1225B8|nr:MCE family protein [Nocardia kruczakiae]